MQGCEGALHKKCITVSALLRFKLAAVTSSLNRNVARDLDNCQIINVPPEGSHLHSPLLAETAWRDSRKADARGGAKREAGRAKPQLKFGETLRRSKKR